MTIQLKSTFFFCSFYITYIIFSVPGTLLAKAILPSTSIAIGCLIWSLGASGMAGAHSYASLIVCRLFVGLGESLFSQSVALHYSLWSVARVWYSSVVLCPYFFLSFLKVQEERNRQTARIFHWCWCHCRYIILLICLLSHWKTHQSH